MGRTYQGSRSHVTPLLTSRKMRRHLTSLILPESRYHITWVLKPERHVTFWYCYSKWNDEHANASRRVSSCLIYRYKAHICVVFGRMWKPGDGGRISLGDPWGFFPTPSPYEFVNHLDAFRTANLHIYLFKPDWYFRTECLPLCRDRWTQLSNLER